MPSAARRPVPTFNAVGRLVLACLTGLALASPGYARPHHRASAYYTNSEGHEVHRPMLATRKPAGATAHCSDGSWSFSEHRRGTCSHHGGVLDWE